MKRIDYLGILLIIGIGLLFRFYIITFLPIKNLLAEPILLTDLLGNGQSISWLTITSFGMVNILLIWIVSLYLFGRLNAFINSSLYSLSPWSAYLDVSGSIYILILTLLLISFLGFQIFVKFKYDIGFYMILISLGLLLYTHILMLIVVPILLILLIKKGVFKQLRLKIFYIFFAIAFLILIGLMIGNKEGVTNLTRLHFNFLLDPRLINSVNEYQGELRMSPYFNVGRFIENKYTFVGQYIIFNVLKQFTPATYFTSQQTMLDFSFTPPVFLGFIIPFTLGLFLIRIRRKYAAVIAFFILLLPSIVSKASPNLERLILIAPVFYLIISQGLEKLVQKRKHNIYKILLIVTLFLVIFQVLLTFIDIAFLEEMRIKEFHS